MTHVLKARIDVSVEMVTFVGSGALPDGDRPEDPVTISFACIDRDATPTLRFAPHVDTEVEEADVVLVVRREACRRLFGGMPQEAGCWHLPSALRAIVLSIYECEAEAPARPTLQGARSVDLLCRAFSEMAKGELIPTTGGGAMGEMDAARIAMAKRMVDERWREKLTLDGIARACGINRDKLSRGFRALYHSTVADALADKRLGGARQLLLATDLPVATVGYRCGYLNNASFTRAFTRRYGVSPSQLRHGAIAA